MKIRLSELRQAIREEFEKHVMSESLTAPSDVVASVFESSDVYRIVLWKPDLLKSALTNVEKGDVDAAQQTLIMLDHYFDESFIVGMIGLDRLKKSAAYSKTGRGWEMVNLAARKGYGPLLINMAIGDLGAVIPDRRTLTDDSVRVWKKFGKGASPGVKLKPLDDEDNPKTKTKLDDAPVVKMKYQPTDAFFDEEMPLNVRNTAAVGTGIPTTELRKKGDAQIKKICAKFGLDQEWLRNKIEEAADSFFELYFEMGSPG